MKAIETTAQVDGARILTITMQVPADVQAGEYKAMVVLSSPAEMNQITQKRQLNLTQHEGEQDSDASGELDDNTMSEAWDKWVEGVENLSMSPQPVQSEYQQHLIEKFRAQGLDI